MMLLAVSFVGPHIESALLPCARGLEISWHQEGGEIVVDRMLVWKSDICEYHQMSARAGRQDLRIDEGAPRGSRPGGEFFVEGIRIEAPSEPRPVQIRLAVQHHWTPFWTSRSHLFTLDYPG